MQGRMHNLKRGVRLSFQSSQQIHGGGGGHCRLNYLKTAKMSVFDTINSISPGWCLILRYYLSEFRVSHTDIRVSHTDILAIFRQFSFKRGGAEPTWPHTHSGTTTVHVMSDEHHPFCFGGLVSRRLSNTRVVISQQCSEIFACEGENAEKPTHGIQACFPHATFFIVISDHTETTTWHSWKSMFATNSPLTGQGFLELDTTPSWTWIISQKNL